MRPFPTLPETIRAQYRVDGPDLALRPFGEHERDLNVDFDRAPRPLLVTELLECCTRAAGQYAVDPELLWQLPIGRRIECLLGLLPSGGDSDIRVEFGCGGAECAEDSEITIAVHEIAALQDRAYKLERIVVPLDAGSTIALRRPTGRDQLAWLDGASADEQAITRAMLAALVVDGSDCSAIDEVLLQNDGLERIERAMEEHDPLIGFTVTAMCPSCGTENEIAIDIEDLALKRLRDAQLGLLASVHCLAAHYHWSEPEIFATPHWRRERYLRMIEADER